MGGLFPTLITFHSGPPGLPWKEPRLSAAAEVALLAEVPRKPWSQSCRRTQLRKGVQKRGMQNTQKSLSLKAPEATRLVLGPMSSPSASKAEQVCKPGDGPFFRIFGQTPTASHPTWNGT